VDKENSTSIFNKNLELFVGKNYDYYRFIWNRLEKRKGTFSLNIPAFFFLTIWLAYRKMYRTLGIYLAVNFGFMFLTLILAGTPFCIVSLTVGFLLTAYMSFIFVFRANHMYRTFAIEKTTQIMNEYKKKDIERVLTEEGGTSMNSAIFMGFIVVTSIIANLLIML